MSWGMPTPLELVEQNAELKLEAKRLAARVTELEQELHDCAVADQSHYLTMAEAKDIIGAIRSSWVNDQLYEKLKRIAGDNEKM